jgi:hypothetical protein
MRPGGVREHEHLIESLVLDALRRPVEDFGALVRTLPGVYPTDVHAALVRLAASSVIPVSAVGRLLERNPTAVQSEPRQVPFPAPHPLDYDWRFDQPTSQRLAGRAQDLSDSSRPVALLGVASLVPHMPADSPVVFLDSNPQLVAAIRRIRPSTIAVQVDVGGDRLPTVRAAVVVADPPWYPAYMRAFVWAASQLNDVRGTLLIGVPPLELRPGMSAERDRLVSWARQCGYALTEVEPSGLRYLSPVFEVNALAAAGLPEVPLDWRVGDLLSLKKIGPCVARRPLRAERQEWTNVSLEGVSIRFRRVQARPATADPRLVSVISGDVLPTVSRRDARRERAMVWTSGNRIFGCIDPELAHAVAAALASDVPVIQACESVLGHKLTNAQRRRVTIATTQLNDLVEVESREAASVLSGSRWVGTN